MAFDQCSRDVIPLRVFEDVSSEVETQCRPSLPPPRPPGPPSLPRFRSRADEVFAYCILQRRPLSPPCPPPHPPGILGSVYKPLLGTFISTIEGRSRCMVSVLSTRFPSYCAASQYADKGTPPRRRKEVSVQLVISRILSSAYRNTFTCSLPEILPRMHASSSPPRPCRGGCAPAIKRHRPGMRDPPARPPVSA